jgi:hypothetical protein
MTDMTTTNTAKPTTVPHATTPAPTAKVKSDVEKTATSTKDAVTMVTLQQLAREMKVPPRDARMLLRLAAKQTRQYPNLGKEHIARQPWQWATGSKALDEARKALAAAPE